MRSSDPPPRRGQRRDHGARRASVTSLDFLILAEAKVLGIDISVACEAGMGPEIAPVRREARLAENREALASSNAFAEGSGLPLAAIRQF